MEIKVEHKEARDIIIKIGETDIELTISEARKLRAELLAIMPITESDIMSRMQGIEMQKYQPIQFW